MATQFRAKPASSERPAAAVGDELLAKFMRGLGDPTRLRILRLLFDGPLDVSGLIDRLAAPQSRVSNHLACLKWCGYVASARRGRSIVYRIVDRRVRAIVKLATAIVTDNAEHVASCMRIRS